MYKILTVGVLCFSVSGCFYQSINQYDLIRATKVCGNIYKVENIRAHGLGYESVTCYGEVNTTILHSVDL